jgi:hypothetical protein
MEDKELPLVGGTALFRTGDRFEPSDKIGLGNLTGEVMRTGGTKQHSSDELNQLLERRAASVETGISITYLAELKYRTSHARNLSSR